MKDWRSQSHVKWDCKYHVVIVPKYRRRSFYGSLRSEIGKILRDLCRQKEIELVKGNALPGSCSSAVECSTEVQHREYGGILEREKCDTDQP